MRGFSSPAHNTTSNRFPGHFSVILKAMTQFLSRWSPVVLWMGIIYWLSSVADLGSPFPSVTGIVVRKFAHAFEFGVLAFLLIRAIRSRKAHALIVATVVTIGYAVVDELHQGLVAGRTAAVHDVVVDAWGAMIAALVYAKSRREYKLTGRPLYR